MRRPQRLALALLPALALGLVGQHHAAGQDAAPAADRAPTDDAATCTIVGQAALPDRATPGVDTAGLGFEHAVGRLEELPPREPMPRPDNWDDMDRSEQAQWMQDWANSPDALDYWDRARVRHEAREIYAVTVEDDGTFHIGDVPPGQYNLYLAIPGDGATGDDRYHDCRGYHFSRITVPANPESQIDAGPRVMDLYNAVTVGSIAPDFSVPSLDGQTITLSDFRGQYVFIDFWATWCGPCCAETPNVIAAHNNFADLGLVVIALSLDETPDLPTAYAKEHGCDYLQGYLGPWRDAELTTTYGIRGIPHTLLIGPDGTVLAKRLRGEGIHNTIQDAITAEDE